MLCLWLNVVWIRLQYHKAFQQRRQRQILLCRQLCPLASIEQHRCRVRLEACASPMEAHDYDNASETVRVPICAQHARQLAEIPRS